MSETSIVHDIQMMATKMGHRLFRNNTGMAWFGKKILKFSKPITLTVMPGDVLIRGAYPVHYGLCVGSSDLIGFTSSGRFLAVEAKTLIGKATEEQINFIDTVKKMGGKAMICRSADDFVDDPDLKKIEKFKSTGKFIGIKKCTKHGLGLGLCNDIECIQNGDHYISMITN